MRMKESDEDELNNNLHNFWLNSKNTRDFPGRRGLTKVHKDAMILNCIHVAKKRFFLIRSETSFASRSDYTPLRRKMQRIFLVNFTGSRPSTVEG